MNVKGVLDRIEDGNKAVILIEELDKELILSLEELPSDSREGSWFSLTLNDDKLVSISLDKELELKMREEVQSLMTKLRSKNKGSRFQRK